MASKPNKQPDAAASKPGSIPRSQRPLTAGSPRNQASASSSAFSN